MRECPYCKEEVKEGAIRCKHCHASIGENEVAAYAENDEGIKYLENGFGKISAECDLIERKINERTGLIFIKHQYSSYELYEATERIDSFIGKMKGDLEEWKSAHKLSPQTEALFKRKAGEAYRRVESLQAMIEHREPTWWEKVRNVILKILSTLFPFLSFKMIDGRTSQKRIAA